ncbi:MAG: AhpC/TSA family protein [Bacteroidales bacterium]|nr:AhpC/TSA family protein [Bacteroidales bacterium]
MKIRYLLVLILVFTACGSNDERTIITGEISYGNGEYMQIHRYEFDRSVLLDSVKIKKNGTFRFKIEQKEPEFYLINPNNNSYVVLLLHPGDKVNITGDYYNLGGSYDVTGSTSSQQIRQLDIQLFVTQKKIDSLLIIYEANKDNEKFDSIRASLDQTYLQILKTHHDSLVSFIIQNMNSLVSIYALQQKYDAQTYVFSRYRDLQYYNIVLQSLSKEYPGIGIIKQLENRINNMQSLFDRNRIMQMAEKNATPIPEIYLPTPNGDTVSLLNTLKKNKFLLLHFWASWDRTSINQILELKKAYKKYHPKGLEIYSVSLDDNKEKWKRAIKYDSITWINVSELSPESSAAKTYNISKIPSNYLISQEGDILAKNLRSDRMWDHLANAFNER